ncbi:hypothetical protein F4860DRAFT_529586 [Xylaria cubensis]|nr:hypothetical protein F4860DRAFT_529586 [Xylaria cubensis]
MALKLLKPPPQESYHSLGSSVIIQHPYYEDIIPLFSLPASDFIKSDQETIHGVHYLTVLTACGIITGNLFDEVYLSYDKYGEKKIQAHRHGLLRSGSYYLQVVGTEPQLPETRSTTIADGTADSPAKPLPYPVLPSFTDWEFPHGKVPKEWEQPYGLKVVCQDRCIITAYRASVELAHLNPKEKINWYNKNSMSSSLVRNNVSHNATINSKLNLIGLRRDLHKVFNELSFVIVPKQVSVLTSSWTQLPVAATTQQPLATEATEQSPVAEATEQSPVAATTQQLLTAKDQELDFAVHFLSQVTCSEYVESHHNVSIRKTDLSHLSLEFLFVHFARAIFPLLRAFLNGEQKRYATIICVDENSGTFKKTAFLSGTDLQKNREAKGENINGGNMGNKRRRKSTGHVEEFNGFEEDDNGKWRLRSRIHYHWEYESESESEYESESEGAKRGRPRQRLAEHEDSDGDGDNY